MVFAQADTITDDEFSLVAAYTAPVIPPPLDQPKSLATSEFESHVIARAWPLGKWPAENLRWDGYPGIETFKLILPISYSQGRSHAVSQ